MFFYKITKNINLVYTNSRHEKNIIVMKDYLSRQKYEQYSEEDHYVWSALFARNQEINATAVSSEYSEAFSRLSFNKDRIIDLDELSSVIRHLCGWQLMPVTWITPHHDLFCLLSNRKYPVVTRIRRVGEIGFSSQPDIFHDCYGCLPLLLNDTFRKFLEQIGGIALRFIGNGRAIEYLGRLYWHVCKMGVILEDGMLKPYGGAIVSSLAEKNNVFDKTIPKYPYNLSRIFCSGFDATKLQRAYFFIGSFDDLLASVPAIEQQINDILCRKEKPVTLRDYSIASPLKDNFRNVIGFLNDVQFHFRNAISFVAGQPDETFFDVEGSLEKVKVFASFIAKKSGKTHGSAFDNIGQYGKTKGMINEIVADHLGVDERIYVNGEDIVITTGAQEAFSIIVGALLDPGRDMILIEDPCYIGISGFARVFGYSIDAVRTTKDGIDLVDLEEKIVKYSSEGIFVKLVYVIPDHQNPTGNSMPVENKLALLRLSLRYNFLIIEDGVYNSFTYSGIIVPTMKSMDTHCRVIHVGSFSKSLFPGLRVGYIVADQRYGDEGGDVFPLSDELAKVKAQITNNTSSISQAIVGGVLLSSNYSLRRLNEIKLASYKEKRDKILSCLNSEIGRHKEDWSGGIFWNEPEGGFFIRMGLPFEISENDIVECARSFNVIICPMEFFFLNGGGRDQIRLTFSNLKLEGIEQGIKNLSAFLKSKIVIKN